MSCLGVATAAEPSSNDIQWPQFRGPGGLAVAPKERNTPSTSTPRRTCSGRRSCPPAIPRRPCGAADFLTAFDKSNQRLETLCLDRQTGEILWRRTAPPVKKIETSLHPANGPATPTPVCDADRVYVYFGSYGLLAYDHHGAELWQKPLPFPGTTFGSGSSPILFGDLLLLAYQGKVASLLAVQRQTRRHRV